MKLGVAKDADGLVFTREAKDGSLKAEKELFIVPMDMEKATNVLRTEVTGRGECTRAALSALVLILQGDALGTYKGQGNINSEEGAKLPKDLKEGMRIAEATHFQGAYKDPQKLHKFLSGLREAGIYATVKGVALKYFWFAGRLPCAYNDDGTPDTGKLLSVSAMQKLLQNMVDPKGEEDKSLSFRVGALFSEFQETGKDMDKAALQVLLSRLSMFSQDVKEAINILNQQATENTALLPQVAPAAAAASELDKAIAEELNAVLGEATV